MPELETTLAGRTLRLESGTIARQADAAVLATWGDTKVLVTVVCQPTTQEFDYFPLRVDFEERFYAGGKIPGGFFKREGRPSDEAVLSARLIDRPIRPLFPDGYREEVHIVATVLSAERDAPPDVVALLGASAALSISPAPFEGPVAAVRLGIDGDQIVAHPSDEVREEGRMDIVVAGTRSTVTMVEGHMREVADERVVEAIESAHTVIQELIAFQEKFAALHTVSKRTATPPTAEALTIREKVKELVWSRLPELRAAPTKLARERQAAELAAEAATAVAAGYPEEKRTSVAALAKALFDDVYREFARRAILDRGERMDGRRPDELRPIRIQVGLLPRVHGSCLFTRGETQSLGTCTLGATRRDAQIVDLMMEDGLKRFMLHYNFPPYATGEAGRIGSPSRRAIGHGRLAEGALLAVLPSDDEFPYIIRVVSEITESNGSSSMASVCSGALAMMDAGVPLKRPVAGVAMGLVGDESSGKYVILTDILGLEDHYGDMDFKVAGTREGVTAFQLDVKTGGITPPLMRQAMDQARRARLAILDQMEAALPRPRPSLSPYAPCLDVVKINPEKIGAIIGPGGRVIRKLQEDTGTEIDIEDDGTVKIVGDSADAVALARQAIEELTAEIEVGMTFHAKVVRIAPFGAFVELRPGVDGLVHISNLSDGYVKKVEDVVRLGDEILVEVIETDENGRIRCKAVQEKPKLKAGDIISGQVTNVVDYGVFVEIAPGVRGLVHKSRLGTQAEPAEVAKKGDRMLVEILEIEEQGRYKLRRVLPAGPSEHGA
ncbi:MAG: Polyribonucleotide nucleotidyltransferase [Candidatus Bipolaricaulis sibiricus]|uniref:Polyribonucleotide nucleotidyltransferase n=1 Tax=Bipolaricaulis sibiricus TaxID=2501609 RepID=A0A410FW98_BIPS1|nr:MAG: Polyribonucleotide nucleotidyltransferase [Candidatus Bipolaricaulis sibiricus]